MNFKLTKKRFYPIYYESAKSFFIVSVSNYLFGMKCLQVTYKNNPEDEYSYNVIAEYKSYDLKAITKKIKEIFDCLKSIEDKKYNFEEIKKVSDILPKNESKYLE